jgi:Protein of unknown function (DUF3106)
VSRNDRTAWFLTVALAICLTVAILALRDAVASGGDVPGVSRAAGTLRPGYGGPGRTGPEPREREENSGWQEGSRIARSGVVTPENLERWRSMTPEERERIRRRYHRWKELSPERRERILERRKRWRELSEEQRRSLMRRREIYRSAPPEEKRVIEKLFRYWRGLPPEQRHAARRDLADMGNLPASDRNERLMGWPFYRRLSPDERKAITPFLFPNPQPGPERGASGSRHD